MYAVPYTYLLISDLSLISIILYIRPHLQADPYSFLLDPLLGMSVIRLVLHNNLIPLDPLLVPCSAPRPARLQ